MGNAHERRRRLCGAGERKAYLTLNRPDRLNAITAEVARRLKERIDRANEDPEVRVIVPRAVPAAELDEAVEALADRIGRPTASADLGTGRNCLRIPDVGHVREKPRCAHKLFTLSTQSTTDRSRCPEFPAMIGCPYRAAVIGYS